MWSFWLVLGIVAGAGVAGVVARAAIRRALKRQLDAERKARSAERLAELVAMTGGLAHEIKNPLSTIGLNAQLLGEGLEDLPRDRAVSDEERQRLSRRLASLRREAERLRGILSDFLSYAGELRIDARPTDIGRVVEEMADFFLPQAQQQGVRLRTQVADGPLVAMIDPQHFKQALLNLMLNAVQAMAAGGGGAGRSEQDTGGVRELILRTEGDGAVGGGAESAVSATARGGAMVRVRVIDTGPGMSADVLAKIFQPYFTTKAGGSGLGLPTTRRLIEAQGGRLEVHSEVGKGTAFTISVPMAPAGLSMPPDRHS